MRKKDEKHQKLKSSNEMDINDRGTIAETIRKSQLTASNEFEYKKLGRQQEGFLNCLIQEDKESLTISYDIHNMMPWTLIQKEKRELKIAALIDVGKLYSVAEMYQFSLNPDNLYYDIQGRVYVKARDIYGTDDEYSQENFLREYKSLIGCTLVKKYKFEDYDNGGQDLLQEDRFLGSIMEYTEAEEIINRLHEEYFRYKQYHQKKFIEISKIKNKSYKMALCILGIFIVAGAAALGYLLLWERPYEQSVIAASEAYLQSDYSGTVEAMKSVEVDRMNGGQKYILATSCVKCESFSDENMNNILNTITLNGDEKVMEYWIYINRLDTEKAADIAMQESSDQLLYYAYLKEKAVVENDSSLTGQEKNERLSDIENKLKPLEDEYLKITEE